MTPESRPSIGIVGAGIIGLTTGWRLAQKGFTVTIFDAREPGMESSWAAAGMLAPGGEIEGEGELADLAIESRAMYPAFVRELEAASGRLIDYQECGGLTLAYSTAERDELERRAERQAKLSIRSKPLRAAEVHQFWPLVRTQGLLAARFYPGDALVAPRDLIKALSAACSRAGVAFEPNHPIASIELSTDRVCIAGRDFDRALIAAGAWSSQIDISGASALPASQPVKGHLIAYSQPHQTCSTILRHGHTYLLQRSDGKLVTGSSMQRLGFDRTISPELIRSLARKAAFVLPHLAETSPTEVWTGFRPESDRLHIGTPHRDRLLLAYGHFRNGILLAPLTADRILSKFV